MTKPLPRAILFAILALISLFAATFVWLCGDLILFARGKITPDLISRAQIFWTVAGVLIVGAFAMRAQHSRPGFTIGLLAGIVVCAVELLAQTLSDTRIDMTFLIWSQVSKLLAGLLGGWLGGRSIPAAEESPAAE